MMTERYTATAWLARKHGMSQEEVRERFSKELLLELGKTAARIAATRKLQAAKVRDAVSGFYVHTWPADVWEAAARGDQAPARPASQRQVAYLTLLHAQRYGVVETLNILLPQFDNLMDEDMAGALIKQWGDR
jgi:hypothetical protein